VLYGLAILAVPVAPVLGYGLLVVPPVFYFLPRSSW